MNNDTSISTIYTPFYFIAICVTWYWSKTVLTNQKLQKLNSYFFFFNGTAAWERKTRGIVVVVCVYGKNVVCWSGVAMVLFCRCFLAFPCCSSIETEKQQYQFFAAAKKKNETKLSQPAKLAFFTSFIFSPIFSPNSELNNIQSS